MAPSRSKPIRLRAAAADRLVRLSWLVGLAVSLLLVARSQVAGDQLNLLARGYLLVAKGQWISYGNPMSTGGKAPGGITSLLVGLPLFLWRDHRAATLGVFLFHLGAYALLDRVLKPILSPFERVAFSVLYWLNPWRLYFSGFLWNPGYLFLFAAVHLAACFGQRERGRFWLSLALAAGLGLAAQIHASTLLLAVATGLLWLRGYVKLHWPGAIAGAALAALPLIPWYFDVAAHPEILTAADKGFLGRGLLLVFPLLRGILYWLRYASLAVPDRLTHYDFSDALGPAVSGWLSPVVNFGVNFLLPITLLLPLLATVWFARRNRFRLRRRVPAPRAARPWLHGYVLWTFVAAVLVFSLSPTTVMMWQGVLLLPAAVLVPVFWLGALARSRRGGQVARFLPACAALSVAVALAVGLGSPQFRCHGEGFMTFPLVADSPMFDELHIQQTCPWPLDRPGGWWPDVLPKEHHLLHRP